MTISKFVPPGTTTAIFSRVRIPRCKDAVRIVLAIFAFSLAGCKNSSPMGRTPEEFFAWLKQRPERFGMVVLSPKEERPRFSHQAGEIFPLGSVRNVLILIAYAQAVTERELDPHEPVTLSAVARWHYPEWDGGVHLRAIEDLRRSGKVAGSGSTAALALDDIMSAAIRLSDNTSADYLLG